MLCKLLRTEPVKERAGWTTVKQKNIEKKQPEQKEATRNIKRGRRILKRSKWRKGSGDSSVVRTPDS